MAVNVNEVYRTVLIILNKEQRGYMTPEEFNKIGSQVQKEIFERYFEDLNQLIRVPQTDLDYSDRIESLDEKMSIFKTETQAVYNSTDKKFTLPPLTHIIGSVTHERKTSGTNYELPTQLQRRQNMRKGLRKNVLVRRRQNEIPQTRYDVLIRTPLDRRQHASRMVLRNPKRR